jgi:kinesin family protein 1
VTQKPSNAALTSDEVWRKDTSDVYVRGEEILAKWRPHGLGLVAAFREARLREYKRASVEATRSILESLSGMTLLSLSLGEDDDPKLKKALALWQAPSYLQSIVSPGGFVSTY